MRKLKRYGQGNRSYEIKREIDKLPDEKPGFATPAYCNSRQTLPERIRYLRAKHKPYMTQSQLSHRSGIPPITISQIENCDPRTFNMELNTLRKIAHALDCDIFINIKSRPSPISKECQPLGHTLPPLPRWSGKETEKGRTLAAKYGSFPWKKAGHKPRRTQPNRIFGKPNSADASGETTE